MDWLKAAEHYRTKADVIVWTEASHNAEVLGRKTPWHTWSSENEMVIQTRLGFFSAPCSHVPPQKALAPRNRFRTANGEFRPPVPARIVRAKYDGRRVFIIGAHMPASVEGREGLRGKWARVRAYREALSNLRELLDQIKAGHPGAAIIVANDWNLNHKRFWVRAYLRRRLNMKFRYRFWRSLPGDLAPRLVSTVWTHNCEVVWAAQLPKREPFDHRAALVTINL